MSELTDQLEAAGQQRLAASVQALSGEAQNRLAMQCAALDLPLVTRLVQTMVRDPQPDAHHGEIRPAVVDRLADHADGRAEARAVGEQALRDSLFLHEAENAVFGFDHADIGASLCRHWNLPESIVQAIGSHHQIGVAGSLTQPLRPADLAAGIILVREAGGYAFDCDGGEDMLEKGDIVVGNETVAKELLRVLKAARA